MAGRDGADPLIPVGRLGGPHGIRGFLRVESWTRPAESILEFPFWYLEIEGEQRRHDLDETFVRSGRLLARLAGVTDRTTAAALRHVGIAIPRSQLPPLAEGEWYWADLIGLTVETADGIVLGRVDHLLETGANDVLVVRGDRERLIPWIPGRVVREVDTARGRLTVDWDPAF